MDSLTALIATQGGWVYALLFAYAAFKSGGLPFFAGYAAQIGALNIDLVIAACFFGTFLGDEVRFGVGRRRGRGVVDRFPKLVRRTEQALHLIERRRAWYIFGYRFAKGLRTIGSLPLGMTAMRWSMFSPLNLLASLLWTTVVVGLGYGAGSLLDSSWQIAGQMIAVLLLVVYVGGGWLIWRRAIAERTVDGA